MSYPNNPDIRRLLCLNIIMPFLVVGGCLEPLSERREAVQAGWHAMRHDVAFDLAVEAYGHGDLVQARRNLVEIMEAQPENDDARILLARVCVESGQVSEAYRLLEVYNGSKVAPPEAFFVYGLVLEISQQYAAAADHYRRAADAKPEHFPYVAAATEAYLSVGDDISAREVVDAANSYQQPSAEWYCLKAELVYAENDLQQAVTHYESARLLKPDLADRHGIFIARTLAYLYRALSRHDDATRLLEDLATATGDAQDRELLAWSCLAQGRLERASHVIAMFNGEDVDTLTLWLQVAKRYAEHDQFEQAEISLMQAKAIDADDPDVVLLESYFAARTGDDRQARAAIAHLARIHPGDPLLPSLRAYVENPASR